MKHRLCLPVAAVILLLSVTGGMAAADKLVAKLDPALISDLESGAEELRVIVHLAAPPEASLRPGPQGVEFPRARLAAVRDIVTQELGELGDNPKLGRIDVDTVFEIYPCYSAIVTPEELEALAARDSVVSIEKDVVWHAHTAEGVPLINADQLHALGITGAGTAVAIIDSGFNYNNPVLGGGPIPNGKIVYGKDTADDDDDPMDCDGHGTAVASIAAGLPHQFSVIRTFEGGVAPDADILAYKASEDSSCGSFVSSHVVQAIQDAILHRDDYNVVAINMSLGGGWFATPCDNRNGFYSQAVDDATEAGIAVIISSGNEAKSRKLSSPGCLTNAISVASVYDTQISFSGGYCLNENCTETCSDTNAPAKTVTCYSNTNAYLDLYAPSEELTAAAYIGNLTDFGGTSGAAPYITGSIALLSQAFPGIGPIQSRFLLELTGEPIIDPDNGILRPLADLESAYSATDCGLGDAVLQPIPNATGEGAFSTATITEPGFVDNVHVLLKVTHPAPDELVVTLQSPDGTRVKLHDHQEGTTDPDASGVLIGEDALYAAYPEDRAPAESFEAFTGLEAAGTWTLEVVDDDPAIHPTGLAPVLVGWALRIETREAPDPPTGSSFFIPVGVHASGAHGTFWVTDTRILNPSFTDESTLSLYFIPAESDGTVVFDQTNITLAPRSIVEIQDIVLERFGRQEEQGSLLFQTEADDLLATSRTYNTGGEEGTYGQFIGMTAGGSSIGASNDPLYLIQLAQDADFRTNIGFTETSGLSVDAVVRLYDGATGEQIGSTGTYPVPPFSNVQVNAIFNKLGAGRSGNAFAEVSASGAGELTAYASVVDAETGDAIYIPGRHPSAEEEVVPISAKKGGAAGTNWVTDLRVLNGGTTATTVDVEFRPEKATPGTFQTIERTIESGRILALDDVLGDAFSLSNVSGSLRIVPHNNAPLVVTSRTYNQVSGGTYGQFIGGVASGFGCGDSAVVFHMDKGSSFRSNVGVCEITGAPVEVRYALKDGSGNTLGTGSLSLDAYEVDQINDIYNEVGASPTPNTRLDLYHDGGDGSFTAYASVVDNSSGDAIFIPAMPIP